ncbi:hypothetical protein ALT1000_210045 [Alteromonas macleodii]
MTLGETRRFDCGLEVRNKRLQREFTSCQRWITGPQIKALCGLHKCGRRFNWVTQYIGLMLTE